VRERLSVVGALVAAGLVAGVALRVFVIASPMGAIDGDEGMWGLMARHVIDRGEFRTFFWQQSYGGTQEVLLTALVFLVLGSGVIALKLVPIALWAVGALLVWRIGRRTVGEPAARLAAVLFWIWPSYFIWKSTKAHGFYGSELVLGLAAMLFALRLRERVSRADLVGLGLSLGVGVWASPQVGYIAIPALLWLVWRRPGVLRGSWLAAPAAAAGAAPWLIWNVRHHWGSFHPAPSNSTYAGNLKDFLASNLPSGLGLRVPFSLDWLPGVVAGRGLLILALLGFLWLLIYRRDRCELLLTVAVLFPFIYAASPYSGLVDEPRYLTVLSPVLALLLAGALGRRRFMSAALLAGAFALSLTGLLAMRDQGRYQPLAGDVRVPNNISPLLASLRAQHVNRVFADRWIAPRVTFETNERIIATTSSGATGYAASRGRLLPVGTGTGRYPPYNRLVRESPRPAHVFVNGASAEKLARQVLKAAGYRRMESGGFVVYVQPPAAQQR